MSLTPEDKEWIEAQLWKLFVPVILTMVILILYAAAHAAEYVPGEVIVKFKPDITDADKDLIRSTYSLKIWREADSLGVELYVITDGRDAQKVADELKELNGIIDFASVNGIAHVPQNEHQGFVEPKDLPLQPNHPQSLTPQGYVPPNDPAMQAPIAEWYAIKTQTNLAWPLIAALPAPTKTAKIKSCESVQTGQKDLDYSKVVWGCDLTGPGCQLPIDYNSSSHGTKALGMIAAICGNNYELCGLTSNVTFLVDNACTEDCKDDAIASCINRGYNQGANIVVLALASRQILSATEQAMVSHPSMIYVCAAGNDGLYAVIPQNVVYPAGFNPCFVVGATDRNDQLTSISNWGRSDVVAPGEDIVTLFKPSGSTLEVVKGSSAATWFVAGEAAGLYNMCNGLTPGQMASMIKGSADNIGPSVLYGAGRVNFKRAAMKPCPAPKVVKPPPPPPVCVPVWGTTACFK